MTQHLPALHCPAPTAQVAPYVTVLGHDLAIRFLLTFGGAELYLAADPKGRGQVEALIGPDHLHALSAFPGKYPGRIPSAQTWIVQCLTARGDFTAQIARTLRTTDVTVRKWIRQAGLPPDHPVSRARDSPTPIRQISAPFVETRINRPETRSDRVNYNTQPGAHRHLLALARAEAASPSPNLVHQVALWPWRGAKERGGEVLVKTLALTRGGGPSVRGR